MVKGNERATHLAQRRERGITVPNAFFEVFRRHEFREAKHFRLLVVYRELKL